MTNIEFCCPKCAFSRIISESEIPKTATQSKCPNCQKPSLLSDSIKQLDSSESTGSNSIDQTVEECIDNIQLSTTEKVEKSEKTPKSSDKYYELIDEGLSLLNEENTIESMLLFEEAEKLSSTPKARSYLAYCRAKVKQEYADAIHVCSQALKEEPRNADHYLNMGRIYMLVNKRGPALRAFRKGIKLGPHPQLMQELRKFEMRKSQLFPSLHRDHFLNRKLGKLLSQLGLR